MLTLEIQHYGTTYSNNDKLEARKKLVSHKMWVLEELWLWLIRYRRELRRWFYPWKKDHLEAEKNWLETIKFHLRNLSAADIESWNMARDCYVMSFQSLVDCYGGAGNEADEKPSLAVRGPRRDGKYQIVAIAEMPLNEPYDTFPSAHSALNRITNNTGRL